MAPSGGQSGCHSRPDVTPDTTAFEAALAAVREAKDGEIATLHSVIEDLRSTAIRTEGRAATAEARADAAVTRAEVADADRRAAEQRAEAERARAEVLADKLTEERMRAEQFRTAAQDALHAAETARAAQWTTAPGRPGRPAIPRPEIQRNVLLLYSPYVPTITEPSAETPFADP